MKLSFFLIIGFLYSFIISKVFYNSGYLQKDSNKYIGQSAIYLNTSEFKGDRNVYLKFVVTDGFFDEDFVYYGGYSSTPREINLEKTKDSYEITRVTRQTTDYSKYYIYHDTIDEYAYFKIKIPDEPYLFIAAPKYVSLSSSVKVSFDWTLSVGEIVGIGLGGSFGLAIIIVAILVYCQKRKRRNAEGNLSQPLNNTPANLV